MRSSNVKSIEAMLLDGKAIVHPVSGVSMLPMLDEHTDAVRLVKADREIEIGDVVMYRSSPKQYTLHRVCGIEKNTFIIRGDNCVSLERIPKKNIAALMDGFIKKGEYIPDDDTDYREYVKRILATGKPLIPEEWKYLILLYRAAITGSDVPPAPAGIDWNRIVSLCGNQKISSAVATVIPMLSPAPPDDIVRSFSESFNLALKRTLLFDAERSRLLDELKKEHIRFLPMKAIIIKTLYPKLGMREIADNDILYDKTRQNDLVRIMTSLGYEVKSLKSVHDVFQKDPIFNFEMHKALFAENSPYAEFFSDILDRAIFDSSGGRMSDEDFYLHFLAHYAKHHIKAGSGLRPLGDLYLLQKHNNANPSFERRYVDASLEKLGLSEFEKEMLSVSGKLFVNGYVDDERLRNMMSESVFGSKRNSTIKEIQRKGKLGFLLSRLFLPGSKMKVLFPVLESLPFLLPICWVIRMVKAAVNGEKRKRMRRELLILSKQKTRPISPNSPA